MFSGTDCVCETSGAMTAPEMTAEDAELDRQWRARFGQPLPMLGCADIVRQILQSSPPQAAAA